MKCLLCEKWHYKPLCKDCLEALPIEPRSRILDNNIKAYSFYRYADVAMLMQSKYHLIGSRLLHLLARHTAKYAFDKMGADLPRDVALIGLDDYPYGAYSHTGIITRAFELESKGLCKGYYGALKAQNNVKYAGQSLAFRQQHKKGFMLSKKPSQSLIILLDDIITTGTSLNEAIAHIRTHGDYQVLFCLTLCDARE